MRKIILMCVNLYTGETTLPGLDMLLHQDERLDLLLSDPPQEKDDRQFHQQDAEGRIFPGDLQVYP